MSVGVEEGSVGDGRSMKRVMGSWKMSYLWSLSAPIETSRIASASVYGRSLLAWIIGPKICFKKLLRVCLALRTRMEEMVHGRVEWESISSANLRCSLAL